VPEADALSVQAELLRRHGDPDGKVAGLVAKALTADPKHADARVLRAQLHAQDDRFDESIATLQQVVTETPQMFAARYALASVLSQSGQHEAAVRAWGAAADVNPRSADAWAQLSVAAGLLKRNAQAAAAMTRALAIEPDPKWYALRANRLFGRNDELVIADAGAFVRDRTLGDERSAYVAFLAAMAAMRLHDADGVEVILAPLAAELDSKTWQHAVAQFLRGKTSAEALMARAATAGERTEAHAYVGLVAVIAGRHSEGRTHLEWVRDKGERNYTEYRLAVDELARMSAEQAAVVQQ
jgi:lipoprotein NlpI